MRALFLLVAFLLLQLFSFALARALLWLVRPYLANLPLWLPKALSIAPFIMGNLALILAFVGLFRVLPTYLALLWLFMLSSLATMLFWYASRAFIPISAMSIRAFGILAYLALTTWTVYASYSPVVRYVRIDIDKPLKRPVRLALASDLHLGRMVGVGSLDRLKNLLIAQNPDIFLLAGDIIDDNTHQFIHHKMQDAFSDVASVARFGSFAVLGNHDMYQSDETPKIIDLTRRANIAMLTDEYALVHGDFGTLQIVGRLDDHAHTRLPSADLLAPLDKHMPIIILDHRPSQVLENASAGVDVQVSGHTHKGQIFPANFIVDRLYPLGYGYGKFGNMHAVVSSGFGFWGLPFRLGSRAEIWLIELHGKS